MTPHRKKLIVGLNDHASGHPRRMHHARSASPVGVPHSSSNIPTIILTPCGKLTAAIGFSSKYPREFSTKLRGRAAGAAAA